MKCKKCGGEMVRNGKRKDGSQSWLCQACKKSKSSPKTIKSIVSKIKEEDENALFIGDTHEPFCHRDYLGFCQRIRDKYKCTKVFHVGDLIDNHAISYHEHDPNGMSAGDEYHVTLGKLTRWYNAFPEVSLCIGNHDKLLQRKAVTHGIPEVMIKSFREVWCLPERWGYEDHYVWNNVIVFHGSGFSGRYPHATASDAKRRSVVMGHLHGVAGIHWSASELDCLFGMSVGCGIDRKTYAFNYGKDARRKPIVSCGVVTHTDMGELHPIVVPMLMS